MNCRHCGRPLVSNTGYCQLCGARCDGSTGIGSPFSEPTAADRMTYERPNLFTALKHYGDFNGRASRSEYWLFVLLLVLVNFVFQLVSTFMVFPPRLFWVLSAAETIWALAVLIPGWAVTVRRLHDSDHSAWWLLLGLVPLVGWIVMLVLMLTDSSYGPNRWGYNPKGIGNDVGAAVEFKPRNPGCLILSVIALVGIILASTGFAAAMSCLAYPLFTEQNLKLIQLSCAAYADNNGGCLPKALADLDLGSIDDKGSEYVYLGSGLKPAELPPDFPIVLVLNAATDDVRVLYADGSISSVAIPDAGGSAEKALAYLLNKSALESSPFRAAALEDARKFDRERANMPE